MGTAKWVHELNIFIEDSHNMLILHFPTWYPQEKRQRNYKHKKGRLRREKKNLRSMNIFSIVSQKNPLKPKQQKQEVTKIPQVLTLFRLAKYNYSQKALFVF